MRLNALGSQNSHFMNMPDDWKFETAILKSFSRLALTATTVVASQRCLFYSHPYNLLLKLA